MVIKSAVLGRSMQLSFCTPLLIAVCINYEFRKYCIKLSKGLIKIIKNTQIIKQLIYPYPELDRDTGAAGIQVGIWRFCTGTGTGRDFGFSRDFSRDFFKINSVFLT